MSPCCTLQNVIQNQKQASHISLTHYPCAPFPAGGFPPDSLIHMHKHKHSRSFKSHALDNNGRVQRHRIQEAQKMSLNFNVIPRKDKIGVSFSEHLDFSWHFSYLRSLYALKVLRSYGLQDREGERSLWQVCRATTIGYLTNADCCTHLVRLCRCQFQTATI